VQLDLALRGTNLPLVRRRGLLLRSDVDLNLHQTNGEPANITGEVRVHDSLLVEDLSLLVPGPAAPPNERPPYFAVKAAPYSKWRLGVQVRGDPALRVYSPIFQGTVGSNLRLEGTLGEPELSGELRANSGRVLFPFGNLSVDHAAVILGHIDPGTPHVEVRASALNYGYRIQMDVNGSTRDPAVVFSSTPPLSSQEILLLLTAGSVPQGRASYSTQDKVGRFGLILGRDFLARLGFSDSTSERLEFRTGEYVSEEGRPTQHWSAYGEYDRFGGINGGLKWRILSR
jgi:translocation and assembly module TamB